ncbi:MAG: insulinase family protein [Acutalibacter sp.]|jgi:Zn-dependent M16 (insulinase) family peptidase
MEKNLFSFGFEEIRSIPLEELGGILHQYEHQKTGAQLCWLDRPEENKTFAITFRTIPQDDTGVFHILEHSVLCGSDKYPVKEPFVELLKNSLNTFLNAFTFPDKTMYPVCSRNQEDFQNLISVYLDAVFHPLIYSRPEIFRQEGWHYEVENGLSYKGVVFNEMKGATASADALMDAECGRRMFPDTCYRHISGGDPAHIPDLTYEDFLAAHRKYYHPSNARIFLDGDLDLEPVLALLDGVLAPYTRQESLPGIPFQQPVQGGRGVEVYELSASEPLEGRCRLGLAFGAGTFQDRETQVAVRALADVLCGDNQAPLKRSLLEKGLAKDVTLSLNDSVQQPWILLEARDLAEDRETEVRETLLQELRRLTREGLDHGRLEATLDNMEFQARQRDYGWMPQGLVLGFQVMDSWLYGGAPQANLEVGSLYETLRKKLDQGYFEQLLETLLLENPHTCQVLLKPSHTLGKEREAGEAQRLEQAASQWTAEERQRLLEEQKRIETWQQTPDTEETLSTLPRIRLDQIQREPKELPLETCRMEGLPVLVHRVAAGGIVHLNLYFALDDLSPEELPQVSFLAQVLTHVPTENHSLEDLQREIRSRMGSLSFSVEAYGTQGKPDQCRVFLTAQCSLLEQKQPEALELLVEMAAQNGHNTAMSRVMARSISEGVVQEMVGGVSYLHWLRDLEQHFQEKYPSLGAKLLSLAGTLFVRSRLTLSVTCEDRGPAEGAAAQLAQLPQGSFVPPERCRFQPWERKREGVVIPGDVSYAAQGGVFPASGQGAAKVMSHVLSLEHLWNRVRVQGGAYGTGMVVRDSGFGGFYSYRDPTAARTIGCFGESAGYLRELAGQDMTGRIIGTVAESEPVLTARLIGRNADGLYWRGITQEDRCRRRREILETTGEDLVALADRLEAFENTASLCVVGSQSQIEQCGELLEEVCQL